MPFLSLSTDPSVEKLQLWVTHLVGPVMYACLAKLLFIQSVILHDWVFVG